MQVFLSVVSVNNLKKDLKYLSYQLKIRSAGPDKGSLQVPDRYTLFKAIAKWNSVVHSADGAVNF